MTRYGDDDTFPEDDPEPVNYYCADCGLGFYRSPLDTYRCFCGPCAEKRDAWTTAQELKTMAKAVLQTDLMKIKDIA